MLVMSWAGMSVTLSSTIFGPHDILFKRNCFSWEQEYRFWFNDDELLDRIEAGTGVQEEELSEGRQVGIHDMRRLIRKIVVAPGASNDFIQQVRTTCAEAKKRWLGALIERSYSERMWDSFIT